jgi:cell division protein FtsL
MIRVSSILFWFALTIATSLALYGTSNRVQGLIHQLRSLNAQIEAEQANIHVLKAEWVYLANPARIEAAARKYLAMHPTALNQVAKLKNLPEVMPTQAEAMEGVTVKGMPVASVGTTLPVQAAPARKTASVYDSDHINTRIVIQHTAGSSSSGSAETLSDEERFRLADSDARAPAGPTP